MKNNRKLILFISIIIGYLALMVGGYFLADAIIDNESKRLHKQSIKALNDFFPHGNKYVDLSFNNYRVDYSEIPIPEVEPATILDAFERNRFLNRENNSESIEEAISAIDIHRKKRWEEKYGDFESLYNLDIIPDDSRNSFNSGWSLFIISEMEPGMRDGFYSYYVYPSQIAFKKVGPFLRNSVPSIEEALQTALNFETTDEKSSIKEFYRKGCTRGVSDEIISATSNRYWQMALDSPPSLWWNDSEHLVGGNTDPVYAGGMFNGYFEVMYNKTLPITYSLHRAPDRVFVIDKYTIRISAWILLTVALVLLIYALRKKGNLPTYQKEESLYEQLLRVCSPSNYMNPYDKDKVECANNLFKRLNDVSPDDLGNLREIRKIASQELGVSFISQNRIEQLKDLCNPSRFMNPYQPEKVSLANKLYARLSMDNLGIDDLEEIESVLHELYTPLNNDGAL